MTTRARAVRAVSSLLYRAGAAGPIAALAGYARRGQAFQVLCFHRVGDDGDPFLPALPSAIFEARMAHIARHYTVLTVQELVERMRGGRVPRNALAITFDDGYRDNLTVAAPILARLGLPATVFLTTDCIGTGRIAWFDRLALALKRTDRDRVRVDGGRGLPLRTEEERLGALEELLRRLKGVPDEARQVTLEQVLEELGAEDPPVEAKDLMLTWDDVRALRAAGCTIGAHTMTHPVLSRTAPDRAWCEIEGSRRVIAEQLGEPVTGFAYPNGGAGDYTETVKHLVREAGFGWAVTTQRGLNTRQTPPLEIRRGGPWEDHLPTYALKLAYGHLVGV